MPRVWRSDSRYRKPSALRSVHVQPVEENYKAANVEREDCRKTFYGTAMRALAAWPKQHACATTDDSWARVEMRNPDVQT